MNTQNFTGTCLANPYRTVKEIINAVTESTPKVNSWVEANPTIVGNVNPGNVCKTLVILSKKLLESGAPRDIVGNVYSEYSVIACILANQNHIISQKGLYNKIGKLFYQILSNSSHFSIMYRKSEAKYARRITITPTQPVELFWIIPMFLNPSIFKQFDIKAFSSVIDTYTQIGLVVFAFKKGYAEIINGISMESSESYKQFIIESVQEQQKVLQETDARRENIR